MACKSLFLHCLNVWHEACFDWDMIAHALAEETNAMATTSELLLALRNQGSGWLATLIVALSEAQMDPGFTTQQQALLAELCKSGQVVPTVVRAAALQRSLDFERQLDQQSADLAAAS